MLKKDKKKCMFDIGYGQLDFQMYSQEEQVRTAIRLLEYHLGKVSGKNYLDDTSLLNKICELKIFWDGEDAIASQIALAKMQKRRGYFWSFF